MTKNTEIRLEEMSAPIVLQVRNDRELGILILSIRKEENDTVFFFKQHHQILRRHPIEVQEIVKRSKPTSRTKSVKIDAMPFLRQYWNGTTFEFLGTKLINSDDQNAKVYSRRLNKEIGTQKRLATIKAKKLSKDEEVFQEKRAQRLGALFSAQATHSSTMNQVKLSTTVTTTDGPMDQDPSDDYNDDP